MAADDKFSACAVRCFLLHRSRRATVPAFPGERSSGRDGRRALLSSFMAGLVSNRHLIQAIHRPASEALTPMTGAGTCDGSGQVMSSHP
jgi:hypothetical protein